MTETQQIVTMVFGAAVAVAGIALMFFGRSESSRNHVKLLGMEFELSTPALAVFLVGSGLFVLPHFLPPADTPQSARSMRPPPDPSSTSNRVPERQEALGKRATRSDEIVALLKRFDDAEGLLTLEIELVNEGKAPPRSRQFISLGGVKIIDERSGMYWRPRHYGGRFNSKDLGGGERTVIWAKFDLAPSRPEFLTLDADFLQRPWEGLQPDWVVATPK
jgi:hypothetical protein